MSEHFLVNAKAYVSLVGAVATALLGVFAAESTPGQVLTVIVAVCTAVGTWAVPNLTIPQGTGSRAILGKSVAAPLNRDK